MFYSTAVVYSIILFPLFPEYYQLILIIDLPLDNNNMSVLTKKIEKLEKWDEKTFLTLYKSDFSKRTNDNLNYPLG